MIIFGMHGHTVGGYIGCTKFSHFAGRLAHYGKIFILEEGPVVLNSL